MTGRDKGAETGPATLLIDELKSELWRILNIFGLFYLGQTKINF